MVLLTVGTRGTLESGRSVNNNTSLAFTSAIPRPRDVTGAKKCSLFIKAIINTLKKQPHTQPVLNRFITGVWRRYDKGRRREG